MKKVTGCLLAFTICFLLASCTATYSTLSVPVKDYNSSSKLALLPLVNLTSHPNAGRIVGDILATELYARTDFQLMERTEMSEKLQGDAKDIESAVDNASALKLAAKVGADTVIYGSVSEYRYKRGLDEEPAVGINLRLLDVARKRVIWMGSISAASSCFFMCRDSLNILAQAKCSELVSSMVSELKRK